MTAPEPGATLAVSRGDLACFEVHGQTYAVDVQQIREIARRVPVTPLPKAPPLIEGVVDLRGALLPVVDLGRVLGGEASRETDRARIVILELDGLVFGLAVDAAIDVLSLESLALEAPPSLATHAGYDAVRAVVRREGEPPVLVLSVEHLLESVYRSGLSAPEDS